MSNNSINFSSSTLISTTPPAAQDLLYNNLIIASQVFVYFCVILHGVYFLLVIFAKDLRTRSLIFINHAVLANSFYPLGNLVFQYVDPTTMANHNLVNILCSFFEIFWPFSIYTRMFSILLIAIYRYIAVFKLDLFKKINDSYLYLYTPIAATWIISMALTLIFKYAFKTTYSLTNCLNGFSPIFINSLLNALFYIGLSLILPTMAIVVIYILIAKKLKKLGLYLNKNSRPEGLNVMNLSVENTSFSQGSATQGTISKKREMRFANQFILMCILVVLTICGIAIFSLRGVIPNYFTVMCYWRSVIRCYVMFFSAIIPVFSFYFNPCRRKIFNFVKSRYVRYITKAKS